MNDLSSSRISSQSIVKGPENMDKNKKKSKRVKNLKKSNATQTDEKDIEGRKRYNKVLMKARKIMLSEDGSLKKCRTTKVDLDGKEIITPICTFEKFKSIMPPLSL